MEEVRYGLVNPITLEKVDEAISETEAKKRGYLELEFILAHLEDENEYVKYFIIGDKKVLVHMNKPMTNYKKKPVLNHERILQPQTDQTKTEINKLPTVVSAPACSIDDEGCISCSG